MNAPAIPSVPPPLPQSVRFRMPWKRVAIALLLAALAIGAEYHWLRGQQQAQRIAWANEQVENKIAAARVLLIGQHWNEAIRELEDALDIEGAANRDAVHPVLAEARRGQAEALLDAAGIALARRRPNDALRLLRAYLTHPQAGDLERARKLREELERAISDDAAMRFLAGLSDETIIVFAEQGQLTVDDGMKTILTRSLFQQTLRRNLASELRKRQSQREVARLTTARRAADRAKRIAHLRDTPVFRSLSAFLARMQEQMREQQQLAAQQDAELRGLFQGLGVTDISEQEQIRADLLDRQTPADLREQIERKRGEVKHAYRKEPDFDRSNAELFDQLVDQEVDMFLKMLSSNSQNSHR